MIGRRQMLAGLVAAAMTGGCRRRPRDPGTVIIGSSPTGVPFSFVDPATNELTGSMVDTADAIARAAGLRPDMRITSFSALIPSLIAYKIDIIAAALLRTPERERVVAFSDPVYAYTGALVVRRDDPRVYGDLSAVRGARVGGQLGTRFIDQLQAAGVENIATYEGLSDLLRDLDHGRLDAIYGDEPILRYQLRVGPRRDAKFAGGFRAPAREELCLVLRKGDPMIDPINAAITKLRATAIPEITQRWGLDEAA